MNICVPDCLPMHIILFVELYVAPPVPGAAERVQ